MHAACRLYSRCRNMEPSKAPARAPSGAGMDRPASRLVAREGPLAEHSVHIEESDARQIVLVMALELERQEPLLSREQRDAATDLVLRGLPDGGRKLSDEDWVEQFLKPRSRRLLEELAEKRRAILEIAEHSRRAPYVARMYLFAAFLTGFAVDRFPYPDRINLLALPLGLVIVWNWAAVLAATGALLMRPKREPRSWIRWVFSEFSRRALKWRHRQLRTTPSHFRTWKAFTAHWLEIAAPMSRAQVAKWAHLGAASLAGGLLLSITVTAWNEQIRVGWASTLCDVDCAYAVHRATFLPVMPLAGAIDLRPFSLDEMHQLRDWAPQNADMGRRWYKLAGLLLLTTVVAPRLVLAQVEAWRARRLSKRLKLKLATPYFRALRAARPRPLNIPVAAAPPPPTPKKPWWRFW